MRTDDFLADLGEQLRAARPRRDLRPALALVVLAVLALAALAFAPRGGERGRPAPAAPTGEPRVAVLNGTTIPDYGVRAVAGLRRAGYRVTSPLDSPDRSRPITTVDATGPRFEAAARALRRRLGAARAGRAVVTNNATVAGHADIVVVLGADGALPPLAATPPRVRVVNRSGSVDWGERTADQLRSHGLTVTEVVAAGRAFRTRVVPLGPDPGPAAEVAADIGQPDIVSSRGSSPDGGAANVVVYLGSDLPGATLLESRLPAAAGACQPAPDGHGPRYECRFRGQRWTVRVLGDCYDAKPLDQSAKERSGCGVRP